MLRAAIESVWDNYDIIVIDSAPNLGTGTINVVCAADVIVVATPAELFDYASVLQFFTMLLDLLETVDLGGFEPMVRLLLTKYSLTTGNQSRWMEEQIRNTWGAMVLRQVVRVTDEVGKGQIKCAPYLSKPQTKDRRLMPGEMRWPFGNQSAKRFSKT